MGALDQILNLGSNLTDLSSDYRGKQEAYQAGALADFESKIVNEYNNDNIDREVTWYKDWYTKHK